uniref:Transcriptional regulator n=1 Tax=Ascaris lumbricoides TaxID=6252 RepID=A0A0M3ISY7_ASCLU
MSVDVKSIREITEVHLTTASRYDSLQLQFIG